MIVYTNNEKVENPEKLHNLLTYLNEEKKRSNASSKIIQYINIDEYENEEHYVITKEMTEILNDDNSLNSKEFIARINAFPFIYIQIQFPSQIFSNIYEKIKTLKSTVQNKLKIFIYITGIDHTDNHFHHDKNIDAVCLDSSVIKIGSSSFYGCTSLIQVSIPSSVTKIGDNAFFYFLSLKQVTFSNPSSLKLIESCAFQSCRSLTQITIPSSVTTIGSAAFDGLSSLTQIINQSSINDLSKTGINSNVKIIKS